MIDATLKELDGAFKKAIESFERELTRVRTGRANLTLLEGIKVDYYGVPNPLNQVAALTVPDPRTILVRPWDKKLIPHIEKAITNADLGLTPSNDGDVVRLPIPALTTERRKDLVKQIKRLSEDSKITVRNLRRDARAKLEKTEGLPEDAKKKALEKIDKETDRFIKEVDTVAGKKEKEIMEF